VEVVMTNGQLYWLCITIAWASICSGLATNRNTAAIEEQTRVMQESQTCVETQ
jgi:hypothetical protein